MIAPLGGFPLKLLAQLAPARLGLTAAGWIIALGDVLVHGAHVRKPATIFAIAIVVGVVLAHGQS